jgi:hypothetical protein
MIKGSPRRVNSFMTAILQSSETSKCKHTYLLVNVLLVEHILVFTIQTSQAVYILGDVSIGKF